MELATSKKTLAEFYPLNLYRTCFGYPLVNSQCKHVTRADLRFKVVNRFLPKAVRAVIVRKCEDWLLRNKEIDSPCKHVDYRAVSLALSLSSSRDVQNE